MEEKAIAKALSRLRPHPAPTEGPLVSIVVTNRDGETHLARLLAGLEKRTGYESVELVLVDNGSSDGSLGLYDEFPGRKRLVANRENHSFSAANNHGIKAASGELVLLANNDIEPAHPGWLGYMVEALDSGVAAVGAMLVYPRRPRRPHPPAHPDLTVQHLGVAFEYSRWGIRAVNMGVGTDPLAVASPTIREVPAVTAACLLARRSDLLMTPFDEAYWYGSEDWDLCLRLGNRGKVVVDERSVLFHHEYGTQDRYMSEEWLEGRTRNHQWFNAQWGPSLMRRLRSEITDEKQAWFFRGDQPPIVGITAGSDELSQKLGERIRRSVESRGWTVADGKSRAADVALALAPPGNVQRFAGQDLALAVVVNDESQWVKSGALDASTHVVALSATRSARLDALWGPGITRINADIASDGSDVLTDLLAAAAPSHNALRVGVATCAPDWTRAQFWGDTHLAHGLMRAFRRLGHEASELIMEEWQSAAASSCDVVIHLRGLTRRPVGRGQWNLLWIISHPDRLEPGECDDYDIIASASHLHAQQLTEQLGREVHFLPQATDADTFRIGPRDPTYESPVLYVGNARWPHRRAPRWLMRNGRSFALYGKNWEPFPEARFVREDYIPNQDLAAAYRSASVVVADHHGSMRSGGFIANRLFDVLAAGGVVLSDDVAGLSELFGDVIPTYADSRELEAQLRILLSDASLRRRLSNEGRGLVMSGHTLDHRARAWLKWLDAL